MLSEIKNRREHFKRAQKAVRYRHIEGVWHYVGMRTILLTGGSGGIGSAIAESLTKRGDRVISVDRQDADLAKREDIEKLSKNVLSETPHLDWIICAHGFIDTETEILKQDMSAIERTFAINTLSLFSIAQLFMGSLKPGGGMIFLSSTSGLYGNSRYVAYSASKAAVNGFTQALARHRPELSFFAICPGPTNTPMWEKLAESPENAQDPSLVARTIEDIINNPVEYQSGDIVVIRDGKTSVASSLQK